MCVAPSETRGLLARVVGVAIEYQRATGRRLGVTGEVGEMLAAQALGLKLCASSIEQGFDAIDERGKRVQIKARRSERSSAPKPTGRLGTFSQHEYDYALLVILSDKYDVLGIWRAKYRDVEALAAKHKRRNPTIGAFQRIATRVFPRATSRHVPRATRAA